MAQELKSAKEGIADGRVDIVVGTHALLGKNIAFKDPNWDWRTFDVSTGMTVAAQSDTKDGRGEQVQKFECRHLLEVLCRIRLCLPPTSLRHVEPPSRSRILAPGRESGASTARTTIPRLHVMQARRNRHICEKSTFVKYPRR